MKDWNRFLLFALLLALLVPLDVSAQDGVSVTAAFLENEPLTLDPQAVNQTDEFTVLYNVCEGLVKYDPATLEPVPGLAESWDISEDGTVYTFHLREGVTFHDGSAFDAADVLYTLNRLANPTTGISYTSLLLANVVGLAEVRAEENPAESLSGVVAIDPQTVEITLSAPTASFLQQLTLPGGMVIAEGSGDSDTVGTDPTCTGPFEIADWTRQQQLTLEAYDGYWGEAPAVKTATLRVMPQQSQQVIEFEAGNLDLAWVPEPDLARLRDDATLSAQLQTIPLLSTWHLRVNLHDPDLSKPEVRLALCKAIDRQTIIDTVLQGQGSPAETLMSPGLSAYEPDYHPCAYDPEAARQLLADAGYPDGITLTVRTGQIETENRVLAAIQQQVAEAGITLTINSTEKSVYDEDRAACNMQLGTIGWGHDYPDPDNILFLVGSAASGSRFECGYGDTDVAGQIDDLLAQASTMAIGPDRDAIFQQIERLSMDEALVIPVYHGTRTALVSPRLGGTVIDANSIIRFDLMQPQ